MKFIPQKYFSYEIGKEKGKHVLNDALLFSKVFPYHKNVEGSNDDGVKQYLTLKGLIDNIKSTAAKAQKSDHAYLKGIYKGGIKGVNCQTTVDYMFFDIDHHKTINGQAKKINTWLEKGSDKDKVLSVLEKYTVFTGVSSSKKGLFGCIHVEGLSAFKLEDKAKHKLCCLSICDYLAERILEEVDILVEFDPAQSNFRQLRYGAPQYDGFGINDDFYSFSFKENTTEVQVPDSNDVALKVYDLEDEGSAYSKFDNVYKCEDFLPELGFKHVGDNRYKWTLSESKSSSSGQVMSNGVFICNSSTFLSSIESDALMNNVAFKPHHLYMLLKGYNTYNELILSLNSKGFTHTELTPSDFYDNVIEARTNEEIASVCYYFRLQSLKIRTLFFENAPIPNNLRNYYRFYLGIKDLKIHHDEEHKIEWVSDKAELLYNILDRHKKVSLTAPTGSGKTSGVVKNIPIFRPNWRTLFIVPITIIGEQLNTLLNEFGNLPHVILLGDDNDINFNTRIEARTKPFVIATYNKASALLENSKNNIFDLIIIDEIHSYILNNSYRLDVLKELDFQMLKYFKENNETRLLGLTGTPLLVLKSLGYYMVKYHKTAAPTVCIGRKDNRAVDVIINNHEQTANRSDKLLYLTHGAKILPEVKSDQILRGRTTENESVVFTAETKDGDDFRRLVMKSDIRKEVNRIYSSPVVVEGTNITNKDIRTVIICSQINWRPEFITQGLARTRNKQKDEVVPIYVGGRTNEAITPYVDGFERSVLEMQGLIEKRSDSFSSINSIASLNAYKHESKMLYKNILAYEETESWVQNLTIEEKFEFMRINYNVDVTYDRGYVQDKSIKSVDKLPQSEKRNTRTYFFKNHLDEILRECLITAKGQKEKAIVKDFSPSCADVPDTVKSFVKKYRKSVFDVLKEYSTFIRFHDDPDSLLFNAKGKLESPLLLSVKSRFIRLQYTLQTDTVNLKFEGDDKIEKRQLAKLLEQLNSTIDFKELSKKMIGFGLKPLTKGASVEALKAFITVNTPLVWDGKNNRFAKKSTNGAAIRKYIADWMRPIENPWWLIENPNRNSDKQLKMDI